MAALSISSLASFFADEQKSLTRGENHYKSNHVESFSYIDGIIRGEIHASMKKKVYKVTVSNGLEDGLFPHNLYHHKHALKRFLIRILLISS